METFRRHPRVLVLAALAAALVGFCVGSSAAAATGGYSADEIEAAFLYRFAGFVSWPQAALNPSVFTIAVLDDDAVASDLQRMLPNDELKGRRVRIRRITTLDRLGDAQILYIGAGDASILKRQLALLAGRPVLVVTSQPGGLDDGSTINFLLIRRHVRFEISLAAARRAGLDISADLLSVATHIQGRIGSETPCEITPLRLRPGSACMPRLAAR
jgi:YfiR/HmsC-like